MTNNPDPSAALDIYGTQKGVLVPRVNLSADLGNPTPVSNPAVGLLVFNTGKLQQKGFYTWSGSAWVYLQVDTADTLSGSGLSDDEALARFNGTSGKLIQNSTALLDDQDNLGNINHLTALGFSMISNPVSGSILTSDASGNASWQPSAPFNILKNDTLIAANVTSLNFRGGSNVHDDGAGKASARFYNNTVTRNLIQLSSVDSLSLNDLVTPVPIPWDVEIDKNAASFIHSNSINPSRVQVMTSGIYEVNYIVNTISKTIQRKTLRIRLRKNGTEVIPYATCYSFSYNMADFESAHNSSSFLIELQADDYIELVANGQTNSGPLLLLPNRNLFFVRLIREY